MNFQDPLFWRAGAVSTTLVMLIVLAFLSIDYKYDWSRSADVPVIGGDEPLFGKKVSREEAEQIMHKGKLVIQTRNCMNCHTIFGNGAYYGPDLTKAWLDPAWDQIWIPATGKATKEEAMAEFLMHPDKYPTWRRQMPNLKITEEEARATVAYLKWIAAIDTNGFPSGFGRMAPQR